MAEEGRRGIGEEGRRRGIEDEEEEEFPSGRVQQVRAQWSVHEDGALAYHLQNEEISGKVNFNRNQRQTVRQDVRVAKMTQEELEQDAALKELERKKAREDEDARMAGEIHRRLMEEEEEQAIAQKTKDEEYAKALQAKEEKRYQRFMEKKREKELERERRRTERMSGGGGGGGGDGVEAAAAAASSRNPVRSPSHAAATAEDEDVEHICREAQRVLHAHDSGGGVGSGGGGGGVDDRGGRRQTRPSQSNDNGQLPRERNEDSRGQRRANDVGNNNDTSSEVTRRQQQQHHQNQQLLQPQSRQPRHSRPTSGASQLSDFSAGGGATTTDGSMSSLERRISMEAEDAAFARALQEEEKQRARRHRERKEQKSDRPARAATAADDGPPPGYEENDVEAEVVINSLYQRGDPIRYTPDPESPDDLPSSLATAASGFVRQSFAAAISGGGVGSAVGVGVGVGVGSSVGDGVVMGDEATIGDRLSESANLPASESNVSFADSIGSSLPRGGGGASGEEADASTPDSTTSTSSPNAEMLPSTSPQWDGRLRQQQQQFRQQPQQQQQHLPQEMQTTQESCAAAAETPMQPPLQPTTQAMMTKDATPLTPKSQRAKIKQLPSLSSPAQVRRLTTLNGAVSISSDGEDLNASTNQSKLTYWVGENSGAVSSSHDSCFTSNKSVSTSVNACLPPPHPHPSSSSITASSNVNHSIFRTPTSGARPPSANSPASVQLPAYPNARPLSLYAGGTSSSSHVVNGAGYVNGAASSYVNGATSHLNGAASSPSSPLNPRGVAPERPASVYHTHTSSSSDRCSTPDKDDVKTGGIFSRNRRGGSSKKKSPSTGARNRNSIILLGGASEDINGVLKIQSPVNCINVAMAIDPDYQRRLVNGDFNASSPVADICRTDSSEFTSCDSPLSGYPNNGIFSGYPNSDSPSSGHSQRRHHFSSGNHRWQRPNEQILEDEFGATTTSTNTMSSDEFSPSSVPSSSSAMPAYARDPRLSQDLSTMFPSVSPRLTPEGNAASNTSRRRKQISGGSGGGRDFSPVTIGDPFVEEEICWRDGGEVGNYKEETGGGGYEEETEEEEIPPQPLMLVRGTKRATLRQSQASAVASAVAKENAGKKKREKNTCKTQ